MNVSRAIRKTVFFFVFATTLILVPAYAGLEVGFLLPASGSQPQPPEGPHDQIIITGGKIVNITSDAYNDTCPAGTFVLQNAVLVDPAGGRGGRPVDIIVFQNGPLKPGTRISAPIVNVLPCRIQGTEYQFYTGNVQ